MGLIYDILSFVLDVIFGLLTIACLLRAYFPVASVSFRNPIGEFVLAASNPLVLPLRKLLPAAGRVDPACLIAALGLQLVHMSLLLTLQALLIGRGAGSVWAVVVLAIFEVLRYGIGAMIAIVLLAALLSFIQTGSPLAHVITRLAAPPLAPIRKFLPQLTTAAGIDWSPLVLIVVLQIVLMVLPRLQAVLLGL